MMTHEDVLDLVLICFSVAAFAYIVYQILLLIPSLVRFTIKRFRGHK